MLFLSHFSFPLHYYFCKYVYWILIAGQFGYESIYGELPEFEMRSQKLLGPSGPSERPWETIFSGSSHNLPPLTKLCSAFLESLLEKRTEVSKWVTPLDISPQHPCLPPCEICNHRERLWLNMEVANWCTNTWECYSIWLPLTPHN